MIHDMINLKDLVNNNNWNLVPTTTGVYTIHNKVTDTVYIGSASAKRGGFRTRLRQHIKELVNNRHHTKRLQYAFNKYGAEVFIFNVVELCSREDCLKQEQSWLDFKFGNNCYNATPTAGSNLGCKRSDAYNYIVTFPNKEEKVINNLPEFAKENNLDVTGCYEVANYISEHHKHYKFKHLNKELDNYYKNKYSPRKGSLCSKAKIFHPDGQITIIEPWKLEEFERTVINQNKGILSRVCNGNTPCNSYYGYEGYYCDNTGRMLPEVALNRIKENAKTYKNICNKILNQPLIKFEHTVTGEIIYSKQYSSTCKLLNITTSSVADCLAGRKKTTKKWKVTRIDENNNI